MWCLVLFSWIFNYFSMHAGFSTKDSVLSVESQDECCVTRTRNLRTRLLCNMKNLRGAENYHVPYLYSGVVEKRPGGHWDSNPRSLPLCWTDNRHKGDEMTLTVHRKPQTLSCKYCRKTCGIGTVNILRSSIEHATVA